MDTVKPKSILKPSMDTSLDDHKKTCEVVWDIYMGTFEETLDFAFIATISEQKR